LTGSTAGITPVWKARVEWGKKWREDDFGQEHRIEVAVVSRGMAKGAFGLSGENQDDHAGIFLDARRGLDFVHGREETAIAVTLTEMGRRGSWGLENSRMA
jgi:hypothetical protein